ncbi:unnamed protein product [Haemonchus placei]|uniref:Peptidase A1 domain-containing protein n=1 Tax=Haemonchus placei TaxID=6290 RepID=A0A0N4WPZ4_HAEPC|nr:unnamed protein product [Haemonchus placei]
MLRLVVFVGVFAFSLAAAPRQLAQARAGGKRQEGQAQVIIVTYFNYVASMSSFQLWLVRSNVERLEESHDIFYDPQLIDVKAANIDGMFGAVYTIQGVKCEKVERLEESHDIFYDPQLIDVKAANIDGMFGAVYNIQGVNCDKVHTVLFLM